MAVSRASCQQHGIGMPRYASDSRSDGLLDMLRDPPVVLLLEVAHGDQAGTGTHGKLGLGRGPADAGSCTVDAEENQSGLPALGRRLPDVGISVCTKLSAAYTQYQ